MKEINSYGFNMADDMRKVRVEERLKIKIGMYWFYFIVYFKNNYYINLLVAFYCGSIPPVGSVRGVVVIVNRWCLGS